MSGIQVKKFGRSHYPAVASARQLTSKIPHDHYNVLLELCAYHKDCSIEQLQPQDIEQYYNREILAMLRFRAKHDLGLDYNSKRGFYRKQQSPQEQNPESSESVTDQPVLKNALWEIG